MIRYGIDRLIDDDFNVLHNRRIGVFTNLSAVNRDLIPTVDVLHASDRVNLTALFSPEHGLAGSIADGVAIASNVDPRTGLPVHSLYGDSYRPTAKMLAEIDLMVCDIQDVGVRYYTFLWTLTHILEACGESGVGVLILDRPNPLADTVDGSRLDPALASLVGRYPIPVQHGMTMGEMAGMINATWNPTPAEVDVIACDGWQRSQAWSEIGRAFVPPSPNMPRFVTVQHYPGSCLIEGTTLSEGRGTPLPFEIVGAPYVDPWQLTTAINALSLAGVRARPLYFTPTASKYAGESCGGIQLHITDESVYRPLASWLTIIRLIHQLYPEDFAWLPPYQAGGLQHFDRLIGDTRVRPMIESGESMDSLWAEWDETRHTFLKSRQPYLLYD